MLIILVASLASCDFDESKHHLSGGELLDDERISEIKNEIIGNETVTETDSSSVSEFESDLETEEGESRMVYWTGSGKVWHESPACSHLKNATDIYAGTISQAKQNGKTDACSRCCD